MTRRILVAEDDASVRRSIVEALAEAGFDASASATGEQALSHLAERDPHVILTDVRMPGMSGLELLRLVKERAPGVDVLLMTAYDDMPTVAEAMKEGAFDFLVKPLDISRLLDVLDRVFEDREARAAAAPKSGKGAPDPFTGDETGQLVGRHPSMIEVYKLVGRAAAGRIPVLLRGETGTGKERVARAIHLAAPFAREPFVPVNCAALPENLLEAELFGHVKGAFTGAVSDRAGRFAAAGRGTVFLDEIGDTSPGFQAKVLRVLESREYYPVGSDRPQHTEARVIAATHRNLEDRVREGAFREDLYYRLRVMEIEIPPLRDRVSDIPLLARHFIQRACAELEREEATLPEETLTVLLDHDWPGNVRELENSIRRAVVGATGGVIRPEQLGLAPRTEVDTPGDANGKLPPLREMERRHLERALAATEGNRTRAAELLGISKSRLYRMLDRHELG
jgi:DNA-binding NtrC family response regulator